MTKVRPSMRKPNAVRTTLDSTASETAAHQSTTPVDTPPIYEASVETPPAYEAPIDTPPVYTAPVSTPPNSASPASAPSSSVSRKTYIDSKTSSVYGEYTLRDLLSIKTTTGSVNITVRPDSGDRDKPAPAKLDIQTHTGSINVQTVTRDLPKRDYVVSARSHTGAVAGTFVHGSQTVLSSHTGSVDVDVLPATNGDAGRTALSTSTSTGATWVEVLSPVFKNSPPVIRSSHTSNTGMIKLRYPQQWKGCIEGKSSTGSVNISGDDVEIIRKTGNSVTARKGDGDSSIKCSTTTGQVNVVVGDD